MAVDPEAKKAAQFCVEDVRSHIEDAEESIRALRGDLVELERLGGVMHSAQLARAVALLRAATPADGLHPMHANTMNADATFDDGANWWDKREELLKEVGDAAE